MSGRLESLRNLHVRDTGYALPVWTQKPRIDQTLQDSLVVLPVSDAQSTDHLKLLNNETGKLVGLNEVKYGERAGKRFNRVLLLSSHAEPAGFTAIDGPNAGHYDHKMKRLELQLDQTIKVVHALGFNMDRKDKLHVYLMDANDAAVALCPAHVKALQMPCNERLFVMQRGIGPVDREQLLTVFQMNDYKSDELLSAMSDSGK